MTTAEKILCTIAYFGITGVFVGIVLLGCGYGFAGSIGIFGGLGLLWAGGLMKMWVEA